MAMVRSRPEAAVGTIDQQPQKLQRKIRRDARKETLLLSKD